MIRVPGFLIFALALWAGLFAGRAQLPHARLSSLFPPGGKAGSEVEVTAAGADLNEGRALLFSSSKISAEPIKGQANKFKVKIAPDTPVGVYEAWFAGKFGVSNPRGFVVGDRAEILESGTHNSLTTAAAVAIGTTVNGRADAAVADWFKFKAVKGQRVLIECRARDIDSRMEASLVLFDLDAAELARSRDGSLIDFVAPKDGEFVVKAHDFQFRGGADYVYRLTIHDGPRIDFILPAAGQSGKTTKHTIFGRNLPGAKHDPQDGPLERLEVEIAAPAEAVADGARLPGASRPSAGGVTGFLHRVTSDKGASNPILLGLSVAPVTVEKEPNDAPAEAQKIGVPLEISGQFFRQHDQDWFEFEAKKGDAFQIEMVSERMGLPTHPFGLVQRVTKDDGGVEKVADLKELYEDAANLGGRRFDTYSRDFSWGFSAPDAGTYRVMVRDLYNGGEAQPERVYRLAIRRAAPDFQLVAMTEDQLAQTANTRPVYQWPAHLRKGDTLPLRVMAFRRDGFNAAIELTVEGLPKGVTAHRAAIEAGQSVGWVILTAAKDAGDWAGQVKVVGSARIGETVARRTARGAGVDWTIGDYNVEDVPSRISAGLAVGVIGSEAAGVAMEAGDGKVITTTVGGKFELPVKVARDPGFGADLKVKVLGHSAFAKFKDATIKGAAGKVAIDLNADKLPEGEHSLFLRAQSAGKREKKNVTQTFFSTPFRVRVNPAPKK